MSVVPQLRQPGLDLGKVRWFWNVWVFFFFCLKQGRGTLFGTWTTYNKGVLSLNNKNKTGFCPVDNNSECSIRGHCVDLHWDRSVQAIHILAAFWTHRCPLLCKVFILLVFSFQERYAWPFLLWQLISVILVPDFIVFICHQCNLQEVLECMVVV